MTKITKTSALSLLACEDGFDPIEDRLRARGRIARDLAMDKFEAMVRPATLADLPGLGADILKGRVRGRVVVDVRG